MSKKKTKKNLIFSSFVLTARCPETDENSQPLQGWLTYFAHPFSRYKSLNKKKYKNRVLIHFFNSFLILIFYI